ncbi:SurA N-terminal domain-containing protein [Campylobacter sp. MOP7]|uniref:peptidylprolyl isomerase n=1 Tax=Campylobacter canis TaxID=3378588 RepID=UPI00387E2DED
MITWMQKHKKYLVVTIWVSTIAFVGAGFVGWGAYDMNTNRATSIAKVGHRNISIQEFQNKYSEFYSYYNQLFDGKMSEEKAKELGLENLAIEALVQENLLLNFADDLSLGVNDDDVVKYIVADTTFHVDGKFDKNLYNETLKRARISPADYENGLKKSILLDKLRHAINLPTNQNDTNLMAASFLMQDRVSMQIVQALEDEIKVDENELKSLWETNKNSYKTLTEFKIKTKFIEPVNIDVNETELMEFYTENKSSYKDPWDKILDFNDTKEEVLLDYKQKKTKDVALKEYLKIKKGELKLEDGSSVALENDTSLPVDELKNAKAGEVLKPVEHEDGYLIVQLEETTPSQVMTFEQAREQVLELYKTEKEQKIVEQKAKKLLETGFEGKDIGFISRDVVSAITGLSDTEFSVFVSKVFDSNNKKDYVMLNNKAVVYEILEQKLLDSEKENEYKDVITQNVSYLKNNELIQDLTNALQKRYKVEHYYKR